VKRLSSCMEVLALGASPGRTRKGFQTPQHDSSTPCQLLRRDSEPESREFSQKSFDRDLALEACERRTQAIVHSLAIREIAVVRSGNIQPIRLAEQPCRRNPSGHRSAPLVAGSSPRAAREQDSGQRGFDSFLFAASYLSSLFTPPVSATPSGKVQPRREHFSSSRVSRQLKTEEPNFQVAHIISWDYARYAAT